MREADYPYVDLEGNETQYFDTDDRCFRCPLCNKVFIVQSSTDYIYKITNKQNKTRTFCSYTCTNKAKAQLKENHVDRRCKVYSYPKDFPVNWVPTYNKWMDKAITKAEAIRLMGVSSNSVFNKLREAYEEWQMKVMT